MCSWYQGSMLTKCSRVVKWSLLPANPNFKTAWSGKSLPRFEKQVDVPSGTLFIYSEGDYSSTLNKSRSKASRKLFKCFILRERFGASMIYNCLNLVVNWDVSTFLIMLLWCLDMHFPILICSRKGRRVYYKKGKESRGGVEILPFSKWADICMCFKDSTKK